MLDHGIDRLPILNNRPMRQDVGMVSAEVDQLAYIGYWEVAVRAGTTFVNQDGL
jgi:hypothetical protein